MNMPNLMSHLKKVAEQKPQATYYNVDMIKYQVSDVACLSDWLTRGSIHVPHCPMWLCACGSGGSHGDPVHSSEPGSELARRRHQHRPQNRLQIQHRGNGRPHAFAQHPVPGSCGWRPCQAPGYGPARHLVRAPCIQDQLRGQCKGA